MPAKNFLTLEQIKRLQSLFKTSELSHVRERALILLLQNDGKTQQEIADFLGCSPRTVAHWCKHGDPDRVGSFLNQRDQERHRKATPEYIELLLEVSNQNPKALGCPFDRWTGERLAVYLVEQTGTQLSGSQIRRILKQKKQISPPEVTYTAG
ncbi:helix-turn-helix domain-containing protein [Phormidium tenue FACHB-886]|nr:helix-turn-helix domain-containing protein [Phormidium tenue FACHB-886]